MSLNKGITPSSLRNEYNVSTRATWAKWLAPLVKKKLVRKGAKMYSPKEVEAIRNHLGTP